MEFSYVFICIPSVASTAQHVGDCHVSEQYTDELRRVHRVHDVCLSKQDSGFLHDIEISMWSHFGEHARLKYGDKFIAVVDAKSFSLESETAVRNLQNEAVHLFGPFL